MSEVPRYHLPTPPLSPAGSAESPQMPAWFRVCKVEGSQGYLAHRFCIIRVLSTDTLLIKVRNVKHRPARELTPHAHQRLCSVRFLLTSQYLKHCTIRVI